MNPYFHNSLLLRALPAAGLALLAAFQANAVIFSFTGQIPSDDSDSINDPNGLLPAEVVLGATFSGTISYDPTQSSFDFNSNPALGSYVFSNPDGSDFSFTLTMGGHTWSSEPTTSGTYNQVNVWNNAGPTNDQLQYSTHLLSYDESVGLPNGLASGEFQLFFQDNSATALSSDALPSLVPLLSSFPSASIFFYGEDGMGNSASFSGTILTVTPVPEPGEWAVVVGGLLGAFALFRRRA